MAITGQGQPGGGGAAEKPHIPDHILLKEIGTGNYGTVWLARNAAGTFRAVKIVERARFDNERPYEREYEGLRLFEPVSREHDGLVDILHLGRNDEAGYFYYVMEAADDVSAGGRVDPERYRPRTLEQELLTRGRLPVGECLEIAVGLASALAFLHRARLIHRDLKPSNIIFVNGKPKIADIGSVTETERAGTFVGSRGYWPPEGTWTPQGDLFSLGKVIYEMATGKDRLAFPSPPTELEELPERKELLEIDAIASRACEPDLKRRYRDAEEMKSELLLLQRGGQPRRRQRRRTQVAALAKVTGLLLAVLAAWLVLQERWELKVLARHSIPEVGTWRYATVGHFDDDDEPDILVASSNQLFVDSITGSSRRTYALPGAPREELQVDLAPGLHGAGRDGMFLTWRDHETNLNVALISSGGISNTMRFERKGGLDSKGAKGASLLVDVQIADLEQDGRRELIALLSTSYGPSPRPRGVCCFDLITQTPRWEFLTAPYVTSLQFLHLTENAGPLDIVLGSNSPDNHSVLTNEYGITDDAHAYLYAIDGAGKQLWRQEVGEQFITCKPIIIRSGPNRTAAIVATLCRTQSLTNEAGTLIPEVGRVLKYDTRGNFITNYDLGAKLVSAATVDLNDDGEPEILVTDRFGWLHVLSSELALISKKELVPRKFHGRFDWVELVIDAAEDLNRDGRKELVFHSSQVSFQSGGSPKGGDDMAFEDNCVLVFNAKLQAMACRAMDEGQDRFAAKVVVAEVTRGGRKVIVILGSEATVLELARRYW